MMVSDMNGSAVGVVTLRVIAKTIEAEGVVALRLAHPEGAGWPDWTPGAHIDLVLPNGVTRQDSLCGDRWDAHSYRVAVLPEPSGGVARLIYTTSWRSASQSVWGARATTSRWCPRRATCSSLAE
ncbi:MAG TPA: hypothetical protein VGD71_40005 [Kribbella sp.]